LPVIANPEKSEQGQSGDSEPQTGSDGFSKAQETCPTESGENQQGNKAPGRNPEAIPQAHSNENQSEAPKPTTQFAKSGKSMSNKRNPQSRAGEKAPQAKEKQPADCQQSHHDS
jgi:hypothetical protein